jgi:peptidoglycan/xylan/chitin deacetylase (PgdA/CDA1 family)
MKRLVRRVLPRVAVLAYHRVAAPEADPLGQAVARDTFARQLERVSRHPVIAADELVDALESGRLPRRAVVLTVDDGYADTLTEAAVLAAGLPLTVFVTSGCVLEGRPFWWDALTQATHRAGRPEAFADEHARLKAAPAAERDALATAPAPDLGRPLTPAELGELAALPGVTIGAHSCTHPSLALRPADEQRTELEESRTALAQALGRPVDLVSYPFGKEHDVSAVTAEAARAIGYRAAFTSLATGVRRGADRYRLPRMIVHEWPDAVFDRKLRELLGDA